MAGAPSMWCTGSNWQWSKIHKKKQNYFSDSRSSRTHDLLIISLPNYRTTLFKDNTITLKFISSSRQKVAIWSTQDMWLTWKMFCNNNNTSFVCNEYSAEMVKGWYELRNHFGRRPPKCTSKSSPSFKIPEKCYYKGCNSNT